MGHHGVMAGAPSTGDDARTAVFEGARARLQGIAFRLLGTAADAEDVVQEAWIRWQRTAPALPDNPDAWLTTVVTRLALDHLRRRRRHQDRYVGPWLPTPLIEPVEGPTAAAHDPERAAELSDSLTTAYLLLLERLTPEERVAFLLADVFGEPYRVVAEVLERTEAACRKLASRGRAKLREPSAADPVGPLARRDLVDRFLGAIATGDEATAVACVAGHAVLVSDGGPNRRAARRPVRGPDRIVRLLSNLTRRLPPTWRVARATVGGLPGVVVTGDDGSLELVAGFSVHDDLVDGVFVVLNPDKLAGADGRT
jgi:RNA polymerase sigma-70 factor, ECF subfamily